MLLYLVPTPENKLDRKGRETGWHRVPLDRDSKKEFRERLKQLSGKGVQYVLGSDLDTEAVHVAANELHVPARTEFALRRFNLGRHHAAKTADVITLLGTASERWKVNPDIPIRGGDSLSSYRKRFWGMIDKILAQDGGPVCIVLGLLETRSIRNREPQYWTVEQAQVTRKKIYIAEVKKEAMHQMPKEEAKKEFPYPPQRAKEGHASLMV